MGRQPRIRVLTVPKDIALSAVIRCWIATPVPRQGDPPSPTSYVPRRVGRDATVGAFMETEEWERIDATPGRRPRSTIKKAVLSLIATAGIGIVAAVTAFVSVVVCTYAEPSFWCNEGAGVGAWVALWGALGLGLAGIVWVNSRIWRKPTEDGSGSA